MRGKPWWAFPLLLLTASGAFAGNRPGLARPSLVAPIVVDGQAREQAWVFPSELDSDFLIEAEPLLNSLSGDLLTEKILALRGKTDPNGLLRLPALKEAGLKARFDDLKLELEIQVPVEAKRILTKNIVPRNSTPSGTVYTPAPVSAYLNMRGAQPYQYPATGARSRLPLSGNAEFAANVRSWVLQSGATFTERDSSPWKRSDTAIIKDNESKMLRYTAGDQITPSVAYLTGQNLGGLGVTRVFAIQPNMTTQPLSRTELLLKRPSTVDVIVNGVVQNQIRLPAGPVNIQDFPLASGFNNVALRVTDDLGQTEIVNLTVFYDPQALGEGVQSFSYHVGAPSTPRASGRKYDGKNINFSFFHRAGLTDRFTGGIFGQGDEHQNLAGLEALFIGRFGSLGLVTAGSRLAANRPDMAGRLRYQTLDGNAGKIYPWRFSFESEYRGWRFIPVGLSTPDNPYGWSLDLYTLSRVIPAIDIGLGAKYQFQRTASMDRWQARSDLSTLLSRNLRAALNYNYSHDTLREHRAFFSLTWVESSGRHYVNASYDYPSKTARVDVVRSPAQSYDDVQLAAGVQRSPTAQAVSAQGEYIGHRATVRLDQQSTFPRDAQPANHISTFSAGTALVWAGSSVSISRPVADSFAILPSKGATRGHEIQVNPQGSSAESYAGGWLPAVLPNINSYYVTPVSLDTSSLPTGLSVPEEYFQVKSSYKGGVEVPVGAETSITAVAILVNSKGAAVPLASGEVWPEGQSSGPTFFSSKRGQIVLENIKPGRYLFHFYQDYRDLHFEIREGGVGVVRLGEFKVTEGDQ